MTGFTVIPGAGIAVSPKSLLDELSRLTVLTFGYPDLLWVIVVRTRVKHVQETVFFDD
ncbi:MAG: hypothetical protein IPO07_29030 [Haliscomenobacter sp.]|nr:hypothetical protein [Haliscomenobacter sp.]